MFSEVLGQLLIEQSGQARYTPNDGNGRGVEVWAHCRPLRFDPVHSILHEPTLEELLDINYLNLKIMNMKIDSGSSRSTAMLTMLAPIAWGTTYLTITELLPSDRPLFIATARVLPAGLLLAGFGAVRQGWRPRGKEWAHMSILAMFNFAIFFPLLIIAIDRLPGGIVASVGGFQPLFVTLLSRLISKAPIRRLDLIIGVIAALGVTLVVIRPGASIEPVGLMFAFAAVLSFSIGIVLTKALPAPQHRVAATGWQLLISAAAILPTTLIAEGTPPTPTAANMIGFIYLSAIATGLAFVVWFRGISRLPIAAPPLLSLAAPATGATLGWIVLGESLTPVQLVGFAITIGAISYGATTAAGRPTQPSPTA